MSHLTADHPVPRSPAIGENHQEEPEQAEAPISGGRFRLLSRLHRHIPTLAVMAVLVGLGLYGHYSDWKLPKFSALTGNGTAARDDWCEEHSVPESQCVECYPDLLPRRSRLPVVLSRGRTIETDTCYRRRGSARGGAGAGFCPTVGEQPRLQELSPTNPVHVSGSREEGGGRRRTRGAATDH